MERAARHVVRYGNRKLYEPKERRFVTIHDLARTVAQGGHVVVRSSDTGENITAKILSRALASERAAVPRDSLSAVLGRVRDLLARVQPTAPSELAREIADVASRLDHLESLAARTFPRRNAAPEPKTVPAPKRAKKAPKRAGKGRKKR